MAHKSFGATVEPETTEATALTTAVDPAPAFAPSDIEIPRLTVVQKMSELDIDAPVGAIVHNKDTVLYRSGVKVPAAILFAQKYWKEDVPFDSDEMPRFAHTAEEAAALSAENGKEGYPIITAANIALLIAQTPDAEAGSEDAFPFELDGKRYALGKLTVQKKSYDTTFKSIASFQLFNKNTDPASIHWTLTSFMVTKGKYNWYVPSLAPTRDNPVGPEVLDFVERLKG
jgi:hypothetical protein